MWRSWASFAGFASLAAVLSGTAAEPYTTAVTPLTRAHSHNDYEHTRPLLDALEQGFCSVEADVYLVDGELLVAHDRNKVQPGKTLQALYLDPLKAMVKANGGRVYQDGPEVSLLIDLKTSWQTTYPALRRILQQYAEMLTQFEQGRRKDGALLVVVSGDRSKEMFAGEKVRYATYDGQLTDLDGENPPGADLVPWISCNWRSAFKWNGQGNIPAAEKEKLRSLVKRAHAQGKRLRFWGAPDVPVFWSELLAEEVDLINTDKLAELRQFLSEPRK